MPTSTGTPYDANSAPLPRCYRVPQFPSPAEIRRECAKIREGWSEAEFHKRAGLLPPDWEPPFAEPGAADGRRHSNRS